MYWCTFLWICRACLPFSHAREQFACIRGTAPHHQVWLEPGSYVSPRPACPSYVMWHRHLPRREHDVISLSVAFSFLSFPYTLKIILIRAEVQTRTIIISSCRTLFFLISISPIQINKQQSCLATSFTSRASQPPPPRRKFVISSASGMFELPFVAF